MIPRLSPSARARRREGFTLIEIILYVALASIVLVALLQSVLNVLGRRGETGSRTDAHYAARYGMEQLRRSTWNARGVNVAASSFQTNSGVLSLSMSGAARDPTVFSISGSRLYVQEASGSALALTPPAVRIDLLRLTHLTATGAPATIQIVLQATDATQNVQNPAQVTVQSSITLRQ